MASTAPAAGTAPAAPVAAAASAAPSISLAGKVAIVTGGSRGIGAAISKALGALGAKVIVNYAGRADAADEVVRAIVASGSEAAAVQADVSQPAAVAALFDAAVTHYGHIDIVVNNAGVILYKKIADVTDEEFEQLLNVNHRGAFYVVREAARRVADGGRIINLSSTTTRTSPPTYGPYAASKAALEQLTRVLSRELGPRGVTVNAVLPGPTATELFLTGKSDEVLTRIAGMAALGRIGQPEEISDVVAFLASDASRWITGQSIGVNGGMA